MKKSDAYWKERMEALEEALLEQGEEYCRNLEKQYNLAVAEISKKISAWYGRFAKNNGITLAEAKKLLNSDDLLEFQWTVEEYIDNAEENALSGIWVKELENASARVHISRLDSLKLQLRQEAEALGGRQLRDTCTLLERIYRDGYSHTAFEVQKGYGMGTAVHGLNGDALKKVLARPWTADGKTFSQRIWENQAALVSSVNTKLTQMIMRGAAPDKAIGEIAHEFGVSRSRAGCLVMTEAAAFSSAARKDCFKELDVEEYKVIATLDEVTCPVCGQLDGQVFKTSDYEVGVTADPFHPRCRCCTAPYFADMEGKSTRFARDAKTGESFDVPNDMTYEQWKAKQDELHGEGTVDKERKMRYNESGKSLDLPVQVGGVSCTVTHEKFSFSNGSGSGANTAQKSAAIYTTPDGTRFVFPEKYDPAKQTMTPDEAIALWYRVPDSVRSKAQKTIEFVDYYNPQDSYWKKVYKNFSRSYATGGDTITFYRHDTPHNADYVVRTYCHEAGHFIDKNFLKNGLKYSESPAWVKAMADDKAASGSVSVTTYGKNSNVEDFAESLAEFIRDQAAFKKSYPNRAQLLELVLKSP